MSGGFGRKGLGPGETQGNAASGFGRAVPATRAAPAASSAGHDPMATKRQAFIDAERARRAEAGEPSESYNETMENAGVSSVAQSYRSNYVRNDRSLAMAYVLWFILGQLSVHRFYLGNTQSGIAQVGLFIFSLVVLITASPGLGAALFVIWMLWLLGDVFFIHRMHRNYMQDNAFGSSAGAIFS